jgi:hypothetical protein
MQALWKDWESGHDDDSALGAIELAVLALEAELEGLGVI